MATTPQHAVVIGGSLAGLCAARALAGHVEQVTVIERDRFPDDPEVRKGVPQAHHLHVLITAGQRALDRLFPGILAELRERGAVPVATPSEVLYLSPTGWRERFPATHELVGASRELIDWVVRRRLLDGGRVRFRDGHEVVGLLPAPGRDAIAGVEVRARGGDGAVERLAADLVVDASGRGSHTPEWLVRLGYERPTESRIDAGLGYASRRYRVPDTGANGWKNIVVLPAPPDDRRGAVLFPVENGRWMLTLGGLGDQRPPTDEAGFLDFARALRTPFLYDVVKDAVPDSPIHGFRQTANLRRHYESMDRWPAGFAVVGDAACTFNPVYGQGMSVAAMAAVALDDHLGAHPGALGRAAQAAIAACSATAWTIATGADLRYPSTAGARPGWLRRLSHRYLDRAGDVATRDPYVAKALIDVLYLIAPASALLRPGMVRRVLRGRPGPALTEPPLSS